MILYVEGVDDVSFFSPLVGELEIRCEPAYGKINVSELAGRLVGGATGYAVVMDSDLDDFIGGKISHPSVYYLPCYSIENLPALDEVLDIVASEYCGRSEAGGEAVDALISHLRDHGETYYDTVVYDVVTRLAGEPNALVPSHCDVIFGNKPGLTMCADWKESVRTAVRELGRNHEAVRAQLSLLQPYEVVIRYLRGHIIFGLLRRLFSKVVRLMTGQRVNVDNRAFLRMLSDAFWRNRGDVASMVHAGVSGAVRHA
ncbi:DUF4435 domain-containing protein [Luteimonas terrae]|uniref:DUF4435 domain-containing protein n=1 Tax=Luteimonas terrae TaxID=1530191 RepID=A0ABU1XVZ2_9GAMM|nr:DUF4435 domain-containing protein [Luteimonas terrae]MDR7192929.1 hypothetical protein [Luteimonas terrae]